MYTPCFKTYFLIPERVAVSSEAARTSGLKQNDRLVMALHPEKAETGYFRDTRTERGDMSRGRLLELKNCTKTTPRRGSNKAK